MQSELHGFNDDKTDEYEREVQDVLDFEDLQFLHIEDVHYTELTDPGVVVDGSTVSPEDVQEEGW